MFTSSIVFSLILVVTIPIVSAESTWWQYSENYENGPSMWGSIRNQTTHETMYAWCSHGVHQSPIDISQAHVSIKLGPLRPAYHPLHNVTLTNNGHNIQLMLKDRTTRPCTVQDPISGAEYELAHFHFHSVSEHTVGSAHADLEVHLVHESVDTTQRLNTLVIAILFDAHPYGHNEFLASLVDVLPDIPASPAVLRASVKPPPPRVVEYPKRISPYLLFPASRNYYTYDGSFTTPPCTEGVAWYVMQERVTASAAQVAAFRNKLRLDEGPSRTESGNNRPVQKLNGRKVVAYVEVSYPTPWSSYGTILLAAISLCGTAYMYWKMQHAHGEYTQLP